MVHTTPHRSKCIPCKECFADCYLQASNQSCCYIDDDTLTAWDGHLTGVDKDASTTQPEQHHSWQKVQEQLPMPTYVKGDGDHPQVALTQAKQEFTKWLTGAHAHPDYSEHIEQQKAQHRQAVTGFVYTQDRNGITYKVKADQLGQLKHASLGT